MYVYNIFFFFFNKQRLSGLSLKLTTIIHIRVRKNLEKRERRKDGEEIGNRGAVGGGGRWYVSGVYRNPRIYADLFLNWEFKDQYNPRCVGRGNCGPCLRRDASA